MIYNRKRVNYPAALLQVYNYTFSSTLASNKKGCRGKLDHIIKADVLPSERLATLSIFVHSYHFRPGSW